MLGAILYRHWLELRFLILATLLPWIALCALTVLIAVALTPDVPPALVHAWTLSIAVVVAGLVFGGTGVRSGFETGHWSVYYTLTLPVSRFMLAWTRLCTAAAIAFALLLGVFVAVGAAVWWTGRAVPIGSMAASMVLGLSVAVSIQALVGLVVPLVTERFSPAMLSLIPAGVILAITRTLNDSATGWIHVVRFLEFQPARWDIVGLLLVGVLSSLVAAAVLVRLRDF